MKTTFQILRTSMIATPLAIAAGLANAGGISEPVIQPAPAPVAVAPAPVMTGNDWTGFYAGGQLGYGRLSSDAITDEDDPAGFTYGVHAGYDYDFGDLILGGELDIDGTNIEIEAPDSDLTSVARAKVRLGYDAGQFMPYVTAGVARATTTDDLDGETDGTFAGAGINYLLSDSLMVGGEVLQHQFDDFADNDGVEVDATTLSLRASFRF